MIKMTKTSKELIEFNKAFLIMQNRASSLYKSEHNGEIDFEEIDKLIFERLIYGKEVYELEKLQKVLRKIKKEMKEV